MKIGIVGTGSIGSLLAEKLSGAGHQVKVTNTRAMPELKKIADSLGASAATIHQVVQDVDAIIFSMPFNAYKDLPKDLLKEVSQEVVVSLKEPVLQSSLPPLWQKTQICTLRLK